MISKNPAAVTPDKFGFCDCPDCKSDNCPAAKSQLEQAHKALLRIFDWAHSNRPYAEASKIEGNTLLQDIAESGLGYWPAIRDDRVVEEILSHRQQLEQANERADNAEALTITTVMGCQMCANYYRARDMRKLGDMDWVCIDCIKAQLEQARADSERLMAIHELVNVHFSTEHGDGEPVLTKIATIARAAIDKEPQ